MRDFHLPGRSSVFASQGLCATSHPIATRIGVDLLRSGGNAVDAAVGMAAILGVCEPAMTGLYGDCFALIKRPGEAPRGLNASGAAPAGLDTSDLTEGGALQIPNDHPAGITLPGAVDGFCKLHGDYGQLGLDQVLGPAIDNAQAGVPVAPRVAFDWARWHGSLHGVARDYYLKKGAPYEAGDIFRAPGQAEVLRRIAENGRAGFYEGDVADDLIASLQALGASHTHDDLSSVDAEYVTPMSVLYKGHRLHELPPNSQGPMALLLAQMIEQFDLSGMDPMGAERVHLEAELGKLAFDARDRFVGDPTLSGRMDHMLAPETARHLAGLYQPGVVIDQAPLLTESAHKETVYLCAVDSDGLMVSMIYSIFKDFGSGRASDKYGILFHNRGCGFNLLPGHPNEARPGRRPMHTIIPALLEEPSGALTAFGVMGGQYQAVGHARYLSNVVDYAMSPQEAIDAPRSFAIDGELKVERGYAPEVRDALANFGHKVTVPDTPIGGAQAARWDPAKSVIEGASDPRKDGIALGY